MNKSSSSPVIRSRGDRHILPAIVIVLFTRCIICETYLRLRAARFCRIGPRPLLLSYLVMRLIEMHYFQVLYNCSVNNVILQCSFCVYFECALKSIYHSSSKYGDNSSYLKWALFAFSLFRFSDIMQILLICCDKSSQIVFIATIVVIYIMAS